MALRLQRVLLPRRGRSCALKSSEKLKSCRGLTVQSSYTTSSAWNSRHIDQGIIISSNPGERDRCAAAPLFLLLPADAAGGNDTPSARPTQSGAWPRQGSTASCQHPIEQLSRHTNALRKLQALVFKHMSPRSQPAVRRVSQPTLTTNAVEATLPSGWKYALSATTFDERMKHSIISPNDSGYSHTIMSRYLHRPI